MITLSVIILIKVEDTFRCSEDPVVQPHNDVYCIITIITTIQCYAAY